MMSILFNKEILTWRMLLITYPILASSCSTKIKRKKFFHKTMKWCNLMPLKLFISIFTCILRIKSYLLSIQMRWMMHFIKPLMLTHKHQMINQNQKNKYKVNQKVNLKINKKQDKKLSLRHNQLIQIKKKIRRPIMKTWH